jgi:hypothetical protein
MKLISSRSCHATTNASRLREFQEYFARSYEPQNKLAARIGVTPSTVSCWLAGKWRLKPTTFESSHLSGFYGSFECLKSISDIQYQTGRPITMPTASVAIK